MTVQGQTCSLTTGCSGLSPWAAWPQSHTDKEKISQERKWKRWKENMQWCVPKSTTKHSLLRWDLEIVAGESGRTGRSPQAPELGIWRRWAGQERASQDTLMLPQLLCVFGRYFLGPQTQPSSYGRMSPGAPISRSLPMVHCRGRYTPLSECWRHGSAVTPEHGAQGSPSPARGPKSHVVSQNTLLIYNLFL